MTAVAADPASKARTVFDILNEPDSLGLRWEAHTNATGAALPSVADAYHQVIAAGYAVNPGQRVKHKLLRAQCAFARNRVSVEHHALII